MSALVRPYPIPSLEAVRRRRRADGTVGPGQGPRAAATGVGRRRGSLTRQAPRLGDLPPLPPRVASTLQRLLRVNVSWSWTAIAEGEVPETALGIGFRWVQTADPAKEAWLLTSSGAAQALADRTLGSDWHGVGPPLPALDDLSLGVVTYLLARALAAGGGHYQVLDAYPSRTALEAALPPMPSEMPDAAGDRVFAHGCLDLDGHRLPLTLVIGADQLPRPHRPDLDLQRFADLPLTWFACGGWGTLPQGAVAALEEGDVVTWDRCDLALGPAGWGGTARPAVDGVPLRRMRLRCTGETMEVTMDERDTTVLTPTTGERAAGTADPTRDALALGADAPVTLELELARFTLTLQELAALRPGDVLHAGRPVGEQVALRVGPRVIARGDLVDVDGEIGVAVTEVLARS